MDDDKRRGNAWAALPTGSAAPEVEPEALEAAAGTFWIRFAGRLIDTLADTMTGCVFGGIGGFVLGILGALGMLEPGWESRVNGNFLVNMVLGMVASVTFHTLCEGIAGTSVGKLVLGYRVVSVDTMQPCSIGQAFIRTLAYFVDSFFFGLPAWSSMSNSPLRQRLGDKWAGTAVIRASALPESARQSTGRLVFGLGLAVTAEGIVNTLGLVINVL